MKRQLICFINPTKFYYFLGEGGKVADSINFPLNNPNCIGYVDSNGKSEFTTFNLEKAKEAAVLIVPDSFDLKKEYTPEVKFKILYHGGTIKELRVDPLIRLTDNCEGFEQSHESEFVDNITKSKTTPYNDVRLFISNHNGQPKSFFEIYNRIKTINNKLEATLDFLKECLEKDSISKDTGILKKQGLNFDCLKNKGIDDLFSVRDCLLEQCLIHNQSL